MSVSFDIYCSYLLGSFHSPSDVWSVTTDVKGRYGLICAVKTNAKCDPQKLESTVVFTTTSTVADYMKQNHEIAVLSMAYLKSHTNTAVVDVYVCDTKIEQVKTAWSDYTAFPFSFPHVHSASFNESEVCSKSKDFNEHITVKLVHVTQCAPNNGMISAERPFGASQMFKLTAISMC